MNPPQLDRAVAKLQNRLPKKWATAVILFGSAARGEASEGSDLDLFIVPRGVEAEEAILKRIREVEEDEGVRVSPVFSKPPFRELDRQFLESILREGIALVGSLPSVDLASLDMEPVRLVAFGLSGLPNAKKVRLERELFGYQTRKRYKGKTYVRRVQGRLSEWGGRKISRGTFLIPEAAVPALDRLLRAHGAKRILIPMWIQRP
jgi:predicted nucleotidyltransferase